MTITAQLDPAGTAKSRRGEKRHRLKLTVHARGAGTAGDVAVVDLSASGLLLKTSAPLAVGSSIDVVLPVAGEVSAMIRWASGEFYGCQFARPLGRSALSAAQLRSDPEPETGAAIPPPGNAEPEAEQTLGTRLARLRRQHDLTLHNVAEAVGVSKTTVWKWESDSARPRPGALTRLAELYARSEAELLFGRAAVAQPAAASRPQRKLGDLLQSARTQIAEDAGIDAEQVTITISS